MFCFSTLYLPALLSGNDQVSSLLLLGYVNVTSAQNRCSLIYSALLEVGPYCV